MTADKGSKLRDIKQSTPGSGHCFLEAPGRWGMLQAMEAGDEGMRVHSKNVKTYKEFSLLVIWPALLGPGIWSNVGAGAYIH